MDRWRGGAWVGERVRVRARGNGEGLEGTNGRKETEKVANGSDRRAEG